MILELKKINRQSQLQSPNFKSYSYSRFIKKLNKRYNLFKKQQIKKKKTNDSLSLTLQAEYIQNHQYFQLLAEQNQTTQKAIKRLNAISLYPPNKTVDPIRKIEELQRIGLKLIGKNDQRRNYRRIKLPPRNKLFTNLSKLKNSEAILKRNAELQNDEVLFRISNDRQALISRMKLNQNLVKEVQLQETRAKQFRTRVKDSSVPQCFLSVIIKQNQRRQLYAKRKSQGKPDLFQRVLRGNKLSKSEYFTN